MANKIKVNFAPKKRLSATVSSPTLYVDLKSQIKTLITKYHSELLGLDYESSGHTGFASTEYVQEYAVPFRLADLPITTGFRQGASIYVDGGEKGFRMSMTALKGLNTKIVVADNANAVDMTALTVDDYIYERKQNG